MTVSSCYPRYRDDGVDFDVGTAAEYNEDDVRSLAHIVAAVSRVAR